MKKILAILGIVAFGAPLMNTVISCGKEKIVEDEPEKITQDLIDEYRNEVSQIIASHIQEKSKYLTQIFSENEDDFFTAENLKKYGTSVSSGVEPEKLSQRQIEQIQNYFNQLMDIKELEQSLQKLATTTDKYSLIIVNKKPLQSIGFNMEKLAISYVDEIPGMSSVIIAQTKIALEIKYQYYDFENNVVVKTTSTDILLTNSNNDDFLDMLAKLQSTIWSDLLKKDSELVWIKARNLGYDLEEFKKVFELFNENERIKQFTTYFADPKFSIRLDSEVSDLIKESEIDLNIKISYDFSESEILSDHVITKLQSRFLQSVIAPQEGNSSEAELRRTLFRAIKEDGRNVTFNVGGSKQVNNSLFDMLNKTAPQMLTKFKDTLSNELTTRFGYEGLNIAYDNYLYGDLNIEGVKIKLGESDFELEINPVTFSYILNVDHDVSINNGQINDSKLGEAIYENSVLGIQSMQDTLGFGEPTMTNYAYSEKKRYQVPLAMTGTSKKQNIALNLWDKFYTEVTPKEKPSTVKSFNDVLSLKTNDLSALRYNLLKDGTQETFNFSIVYFDFDKDKKAFEYDDGTPKRDLSLQTTGWKSGKLYGSPNNQKYAEITGLRIKQNFIDIAIGFEEINNFNEDYPNPTRKWSSVTYFVIEKLKKTA